MRMDASFKKKRKIPELSRGAVLGIGVGLIALAVVMLGVALWDSFGSAAHFQVIRVPGFHELKLDKPGLYVGVYQHLGQGPVPVRELTRLDVRVISKDDGSEVPVLLNTAGQAVSRMGFKGMPLFNFDAPSAGDYTLSAVYVNGETGPNVPVILFHQEVIDIKQTLIVGGLFFVLFAGLGLWVLIKGPGWAADFAHDPAAKTGP